MKKIDLNKIKFEIYCPACGFKLTEHWQIEPNDGEEDYFCYKCGYIINKEWKKVLECSTLEQ